MNNDMIFVGIASYRDSELIPTLLDMIQQAEQPERLHVAVCWQDNQDLSRFIACGFACQQTGEHLSYPLYQLMKDTAVIQLLAINYLQSQGACWARHISNSLFSGEQYHLQIDSHSRFIPRWDSEMIAMLESLRSKSARPVLTHYPPPYTPCREAEKCSDQVSRLVFNHFNDKGIPSLQSVAMNESTPRAGGFLAAGFIFCDGHFVENVPYDPQLFFNGEEISLAARAYTHGYDLYTPHKVLIWHFYGRNESPKYWSDHTDEAKKRGDIGDTWWERDAISCQRIRSLLATSDEPIKLGRWGLGQQRSLQEFQYRVGIDFRRQLIHSRAVSDEKITWFEPLPEDHDRWQQALISRNERVWRLQHTEIDFSQTNILWWQLSVHQTDNVPLMNQQFSSEEIKKLIHNDDGESFDFRVQFDTPFVIQAQNMRLCPYIDGEGWGEIKEFTW